MGRNTRLVLGYPGAEAGLKQLISCEIFGKTDQYADGCLAEDR
jgi:hypothetical protein